MNKENLYDLGVELYEKERFAEAINVLLNLHTENPDDINVILLLAGCYNGIMHFTDAARLLLYADKLESNNPMIKYNLGYTLLCMGRLNDAMNYIKKCLQLNPPNEINDLAKRMLNSEEYFAGKMENNYNISLEEEFECENKFQKAQKHLYNNEFKEAIALYISILEKKPNFDQAIQNIGVCYIHDKKPEESLKYFEKVLSISPNDGLCLGNFAHAYYLLGDLEKSLEYSKKVMVAVKKPLLRDLMRLVTLFIEIKQFEFARTLLDTYSNAYDNVQLTFLSGVLYAKQNDYLAAKKEFQSISKYSELAKKYCDKTQELIEGTIKEYNFELRTAIDATEDMI